MRIELDMPTGLAEQLKQVVLNATKEAIEEQQKKIQAKQWLSIKEAAAYAGVSYNTFIKFRELGLKVAQIEGVQRVNKNEIDRFLENHSY